MKLTLDRAADRFRAAPTAANAKTYQQLALEYWYDEMIGDQSLIQILVEIKETDV